MGGVNKINQLLLMKSQQYQYLFRPGFGDMSQGRKINVKLKRCSWFGGRCRHSRHRVWRLSLLSSNVLSHYGTSRRKSKMQSPCETSVGRLHTFWWSTSTLRQSCGSWRSVVSGRCCCTGRMQGTDAYQVLLWEEFAMNYVRTRSQLSEVLRCKAASRWGSRRVGPLL